MPVNSSIRFMPTRPIAAPAPHGPAPSSSRASSQNPSAANASSAADSVAITAYGSIPATFATPPNAR